MDGIALDTPVQKKISAYHLVSIFLALLFCTLLRVSLLFTYPLVVIFLFYVYRWKLDRNAIYLLVFVLCTWLFSFRHGLYLMYNTVSLYFFVPFLLLLFAIPTKTDTSRNHLHSLMWSVTLVAIVNNLIGVVQYINHPYDDSFEGIYGTFTVSQNGLSLVNAVLFFYHITRYQHWRKTINLVLAIFFITCCILGFYGAGLIAFLGALVLTFLKFKPKNIIALGLLMFVLLAIMYVVMKTVSPLTLDYNVNILKKFLDPTAPNAPRKLIIFRNYYEGYSQNITDLLFGSGPGTFNSRSAFSVGSPTYFNVDFIKSSVQPEYFRNYAYPLWNASNTGPFDGFMNQPFSSLLALLGEYGLLFVLGALYVVVSRYSKVVKAGNSMAKTHAVSTEFKMYKFCSIFALLLIVIDNYMEYPEIIALLLIIVKLSLQRLRSAFEGY